MAVPLIGPVASAPLRFLGAANRDGELILSLIEADDAGDVQIIDSLSTGWTTDQFSTRVFSAESVSLDDDRLWLRSYDENRRKVLNAVTWSEETVQLSPDLSIRFAGHWFSFDEHVVAPDVYGVNVLQLGAAMTAQLDWAPEVLDRVELADATVTLEREFLQAPVLVVTQNGEETRLSMSLGAERLFVAGSQVVVSAILSSEQCAQQYGECDSYTQELAVVETTGTPELVARVKLPTAPENTDAVTIEQYYLEPVMFDDGTWLLSEERYITCRSQAACDELNIVVPPAGRVNAPAATDACPPTPAGAAPAEEPVCELPTSPAEPAVSASGVQRLSYRLSLGDKPRLSDPVVSSPEGADDAFIQQPLAGTHLGVTHLARVGTAVPGKPQLARFTLDIHGLDEDGFTAARSFNLPGYPLVLLNDAAELISVEPRAEGGADVHYLRRRDVAESQVFEILSTRTLPARYAGSRWVNEHIVVLQTPDEDCDPGTSFLYAVALDELGELAHFSEQNNALALPGAAWSIAGQWQDHLLLRSPEYWGYAVVEIDEPPELVHFSAGHGAAEVPHLNAETISGGLKLGGGQSIRWR